MTNPLKHEAPGFTILEGLIVLAVFGVFATLAVLSLNNARARMRDAQRLSNVSIVRTALSRYWLEKATYPSSAGVDLAAPGTKTDVLTAEGFLDRGDLKDQVLYIQVPAGPNVGEYYHYKGTPNGFSLRVKTERDTDLGKANYYYAHSTGIDQEDVMK
ncbi:type II secretion system protein [Patescibacteria group bacterium]|nr:type II secretion system protein [Patescibacteria group bacterium]